LFSLVYREALRNDKVVSNPARLVRQKNEGSGRIRYLLDNEEQAIKQTIVTMFPEHLPELVIAIGTGVRKSEQYTLDWTQTDVNRKVIKLKKTKNHLAREVPMNSDVLAAFETLRGNVKKPTGRVFPISNPKGWFESARAKSGVKDFRWHDCRHTFCSRLAMAGVPLKTIQVLAGHKTISITARYAHLAPSTLRNAVELVTQIQVKSPVQTATGTATNQKQGNRKEATQSYGAAINS
jgi:integrase